MDECLRVIMEVRAMCPNAVVTEENDKIVVEDVDSGRLTEDPLNDEDGNAVDPMMYYGVTPEAADKILAFNFPE